MNRRERALDFCAISRESGGGGGGRKEDAFMRVGSATGERCKAPRERERCTTSGPSSRERERERERERSPPV